MENSEYKQLKEQLLLTLQPADNKTSTPDHLALGAPHLADQGIVGGVLPDALHFQNFLCPGGKIGLLGQFPQDSLDFHHGGSMGQSI